MSAGTSILKGALNPDAVLEETRQVESAIDSTSMPRQLALDLVASRGSLAVLRVREADAFMASPAFARLVENGRPLRKTVTVPSWVRAIETPRPEDSDGPEAPEYSPAEAAQSVISRRVEKLRALHSASEGEA
mmetsp:Transcript_4529/g.10993  ORF Transcript_4529/g.10993 Transcript_4529/m.10993 type:complete len:133 (-) Transcript_4529:18-416(-)